MAKKIDTIINFERALAHFRDASTAPGTYRIVGTDCSLVVDWRKTGFFKKEKVRYFLASGEKIDPKWIFRIYKDERINLKKEIKIKQSIHFLENEDRFFERERLAYQADFREKAEKLLKNMLKDAVNRGYSVELNVNFR